MAGFTDYIKESYDELKNHVTWPAWTEVQRLTVVVAVFAVIFSFAIWGIDTVFERVIEVYLSWI